MGEWLKEDWLVSQRRLRSALHCSPLRRRRATAVAARGAVQPCIARLSTVLLGMARRGTVRLGMAQLGTAVSFHIAASRFFIAATSDRSLASMPAATRHAGLGS